jgi:hypothetical protein
MLLALAEKDVRQEIQIKTKKNLALDLITII